MLPIWVRKGFQALVLILILISTFVPVPLRGSASPAQAVQAIYGESFENYNYKYYTDHLAWDPYGKSLSLMPAGAPYISSNGTSRNPDGSIWIVLSQPSLLLLDSLGNPLWQNPLPISNAESAISVASDNSGNAVLAWKTGNQLFIQKVNQQGQKIWQSDVVITTLEDPYDHIQIEVIIALDGSAIVAWTSHIDSMPGLFLQKIDSQGQKAWAQDRPGTRTQSMVLDYMRYPVFAILPGNYLLEVWTKEDGQALAQKVNLSDGSWTWAQDMPVGPAPGEPGFTGQQYPAVISDGAAGVLVTWIASNSAYEPGYVVMQHLTSTGSRVWAAPKPVSTGLAECLNLRVNPNPDKTFDIYWIDAYSSVYYQNSLGKVPVDMNLLGGGGQLGGRRIRFQRVDASGNRAWASENEIQVDKDIFFLDWLVITNDTILVFYDYPWIWAFLFDRSGNPLWPGPSLVLGGNTQVDQTGVEVTTNAAGYPRIVWSDERPAINISQIDPDSNSIWDQPRKMELSADDGFVIARDSEGGTAVIWRTWANTHFDIYAQRVDERGFLIWPAPVLVTDHAVSGDFDAAFDPDGSLWVIWFNEVNDIDQVFVQKIVSFEQTAWTQPKQVSHTADRYWQTHAKIAITDSGSALVAWEAPKEPFDDSRIYGQVLDANGNFGWGLEKRLIPDHLDQRDQLLGDLGADHSGRWVIVWSDSQNGASYGPVYLNWINNQGDRLVMNDIQITTGIYNQSPYVFVDGMNRVLVAWSQFLTDDFVDGNIMLQRFSYPGSRAWPADITCNTSPVSGWAVPTSVTADMQGNAYVAWNQNNDVLVKKVNSIGGMVWPSDYNPETFDQYYLPEGIAISKKINNQAGSVNTATISAGYALNGGSVQFYLSSDGGFTWVPAPENAAVNFSPAGSDLRWKAVLKADPYQHRTPVVHSIQVRYGLYDPNSDPYEVDDTCPQASTISVGAQSQRHNFYQNHDEDWVVFTGVAGSRYVIQTSEVEARANTILGVTDSCSSPPPGEDNPLGPDYTMEWQALYSGQQYIRVTNKVTSDYGEDTHYTLTVRQLLRPPVVIIVAGNNGNTTLQTAIDNSAIRAYHVFRDANIPADNIRFYSLNSYDLDENGVQDDIAGPAEPAAIRDAIQTWAAGKTQTGDVPFYLYMVDHGYYDIFYANGILKGIRAEDLDLWLTNLEEVAHPAEINVIIEACRSGSFINISDRGPSSISKTARVVITSAADTQDAQSSFTSVAFSDAFWTQVGQGKDLKAAYEFAAGSITSIGYSQTPWLDDNGDQAADQYDGAFAAVRGLGKRLSGLVPVIDNVWVTKIENGVGQINVQARDDTRLSQVWAMIFPPNYTPPPPSEDGTIPVPDIPTVNLIPDGNGGYTITYGSFAQIGMQRIVVFARDEDENLAMPIRISVCENCPLFLPLIKKTAWK